MTARMTHAAAAAAGGGPSAARYWRILYVNNDGHGLYDALAEVEFRATLGGADLTTPAGAVAGAVASSEINSSNIAAYAFNNINGDNWVSATTPGSWLRYDFGSAVTVAQVALMAHGGALTTAPKDFHIQSSASTSGPWDTRASPTGQTGWSGGVFRLFTVV